jgi:hypothetical protein
MKKLVDDAVRVLRELPEDVQAAAARAIIEYGAGYDDDLALSNEQVGEVVGCVGWSTNGSSFGSSAGGSAIGSVELAVDEASGRLWISIAIEHGIPQPSAAHRHKDGAPHGTTLE